jgi:hypothetical protein
MMSRLSIFAVWSLHATIIRADAIFHVTLHCYQQQTICCKRQWRDHCNFHVYSIYEYTTL